MKLTDTLHASTCNPACCDCPTLGELLSEATCDLNSANAGIGIPPWLTREQAIEQAQAHLARLWARKNDDEPLFSTNPDVFFGCTLMRACGGTHSLCSEKVVRGVAECCGVTDGRGLQLASKLAECGCVRTEPRASDYEPEPRVIMHSDRELDDMAAGATGPCDED